MSQQFPFPGNKHIASLDHFFPLPTIKELPTIGLNTVGQLLQMQYLLDQIFEFLVLSECLVELLVGFLFGNNVQVEGGQVGLEVGLVQLLDLLFYFEEAAVARLWAGAIV